MSHAHDIDNDDPFFLLHPYEPLNTSRSLEGSAPEPRRLSASDDSPQTHSTLPSGLSPDWFYNKFSSPASSMNDEPSSLSKGKGVSQPLYIQGREPVDVVVDILPVIGSTSSSSSVPEAVVRALGHLDEFAESSPAQFAQYDPLVLATDPLGESLATSSAFSGKGKGRELPPVLPPLAFAPTSFESGSSEWSSFDMSPQTAGPSSYGSGFASITEFEPSVSPDVTPPVSPETSTPVDHVPARRRSLSNLSVRSTRSLSALSISNFKVKLTSTKGPGNIARKLLFRKRDIPNATTAPATPGAVIDTELPAAVDLGHSSCLLPWARELKSCTSPPQGTLVAIDVASCGVVPAFATYRAGPPWVRTKGRSNSSPFPLPTASPLDLVPVTPADISEPIPINTPNYFDEVLPRELKIHILAVLVQLHEADHLRALSSGKWSASRAGLSRNRWVGIEKGTRELLRLSRVSTNWQSLVYDGQLWTKLPKLPLAVLSRLCNTVGGFARRMELAGLTDLSSDILVDITDRLSANPSGLPQTRITTINLQGCTAISTGSLHNLLSLSPALRKLCVKGLSAVINGTCDILAESCPRLVSLDMSRCTNVDGNGICSLASSTLQRGGRLQLKVLRLNGLRRVTDDMMRCLGWAAPDLEVLELSHASHIHNSAIEAFVSLTEEEAKDVNSVQLTAREAGRDPADSNKFWRRVTRLRHLALSSCILLTDHACSHLAHAAPRLEFLELAGIGADLQDEGLVRLLATTPYIRRLDLEDASDISDAVLTALTPRVDATPPSLPRGAPPPPPQTGHALEHLVISYAANVTTHALLDLIHNCPRLRQLEADNTRMNGLVAKEFVAVARERKIVDPYLAAIDCRGVGEHAVKDLTGQTRPRLGWCAWDARKLAYLDGRDEEGALLNVGQDECDEMRVVLKTFYSWQTVDAVRAAREKEKKRKAAKRTANGSGSSGTGDGDGAGFAAGRTRWWSPTGRRSGAVSPRLPDGLDGRDGCTIM